MKRFFLIFSVFLINFFNTAYAAVTIEIPSGTPIVVDGAFSDNEWADASTAEINLLSGNQMKIYYKHDAENLYFAYCSNIFSTYNVRCPEILFDINNDKSTQWAEDDWWFHVSGTDCYSKGVYGDYTTCLLVQPDWTANNLMEDSFNDTVEIIIPFSTIELETSGIKTIGICFEATDTQTTWEYSIPGANKDKPSSWAEAVIDFSTNSINPEYQDLQVRQSSNGNILNIIGGENYANSKFEIYNSNGFSLIESDFKNNIDISLLSNGIYFLRLEFNNKIEIEKFIVIR